MNARSILALPSATAEINRVCAGVQRDSFKPTGETMAIKRVDHHHLIGVREDEREDLPQVEKDAVRRRGTLTVENDDTSSVPGQPSGKVVEIRVKK
jgi:hypothetical protein